MIKIVFILTLIYFSNVAEASAQAAYLRRISILLRGINPSNQDLNYANSLSGSKFTEYLNNKIDEYETSDLFVEKMRIRILNMLKINPTSKYLHELYNPTELEQEWIQHDTPSNESSFSALDIFIENVIKNNEKWDLLFSSSDYYLKKDFSNIEKEIRFYYLTSKLIQPNNNMRLAPKGNGESNFLFGVFTTNRFYERYFTSTDSIMGQNAINEILFCNHNYTEFNLKLISYFLLNPLAPFPSPRYSSLKKDLILMQNTSTYRKCQTQRFYEWFSTEKDINEKDFENNIIFPKKLIKKILMDSYKHFKMALEKSPPTEHHFYYTLEGLDYYLSIIDILKINTNQLYKCKLDHNAILSIGIPGNMHSTNDLSRLFVIQKCLRNILLKQDPELKKQTKISWEQLPNETKLKTINDQIILILGNNIYPDVIINKISKSILNYLNMDTSNPEIKYSYENYIKYILLTSTFFLKY